MKTFLAVNYGVYEGWKLEELPIKEALQKVKMGDGIYGNEWKILAELDVAVIDIEDKEPIRDIDINVSGWRCPHCMRFYDNYYRADSCCKKRIVK